MNQTGSLPQVNIGVNLIQSSQVEEQILVLTAASQDLDKMVSEIEAKLISVIRPIPKKDESPSVPEPVLVPLAEKLRDSGRSFNRSINRLRELNSVIELTA